MLAKLRAAHTLLRRPRRPHSYIFLDFRHPYSSDELNKIAGLGPLQTANLTQTEETPAEHVAYMKLLSTAHIHTVDVDLTLQLSNIQGDWLSLTLDCTQPDSFLQILEKVRDLRTNVFYLNNISTTMLKFPTTRDWLAQFTSRDLVRLLFMSFPFYHMRLTFTTTSVRLLLFQTGSILKLTC